MLPVVASRAGTHANRHVAMHGFTGAHTGLPCLSCYQHCNWVAHTVHASQLEQPTFCDEQKGNASCLSLPTSAWETHEIADGVKEIWPLGSVWLSSCTLVNVGTCLGSTSQPRWWVHWPTGHSCYPSFIAGMLARRSGVDPLVVNTQTIKQEGAHNTLCPCLGARGRCALHQAPSDGILAIAASPSAPHTTCIDQPTFSCIPLCLSKSS